MRNVVYFLGAGFSAPLGLPVMANFLEKSKDQYFQNPKKFDHYKVVFDKINSLHVSKTYYDTDLLNIEEILSILEIDKQLKGNPNDDIFTKFISDVIQFYTPKITTDVTNSSNAMLKIFGTQAWKLYCGFVSGLLHLRFVGTKPEPIGGMRYYKIDPFAKTDINYGVITVNYDLVLENSCKYLAEGFAVSSLGLVRSLDTKPLPDGKSYLAKLHGSIDSGDIIPPTWYKQFAQQHTIDNWKVARALLADATDIRIIGYSLPETDSYIRYLLRAAVVDAQNLKHIDVICLDRRGDVRKRYDDFVVFKNYRFLNITTQDYLGVVDRLLGNTWPDLAIFDGLLELAHERAFSDV